MLISIRPVVKFFRFSLTGAYGIREKHTIFKRALIPMLFAQQQSSSSSTVRQNTNTTISKNLQLFSSQESESNDKHLVLLLSWLLAKKRHLQKYNKFYNKHGFDVLCVDITPYQLLQPTTGTQVVAKDILNFLTQQQQYKGIIIHGFSVGAYVFGECLIQMEQDINRFRPLVDKFIGQIYDSAVDFDGIPTGIPRAMTKNTILQKLIEIYIRTHMKIFYNAATKHYLKSSEAFHNNFVHVPALFLFSKTDPVGTAEGNLTVLRKWEMRGVPVYAKCWESSPHVSHFHHHPDEYLEELSTFLHRLGMLAECHRHASKL